MVIGLWAKAAVSLCAVRLPLWPSAGFRASSDLQTHVIYIGSDLGLDEPIRTGCHVLRVLSFGCMYRQKMRLKVRRSTS